ncbi:MAG: hypothetical protein PHP83_03025 [Clostridia bacterium]|nr:hypothetical protein [Clostridia bacterium]
MDLCKLFAAVLFCLSLTGCDSCTSKKDGSISDLSTNKTEEEEYQFTFNGIRMNSGMSLDEIKQANPNIRMEEKKTPGYNSLLGSTEPYTYYDVYSPSNDRACVIVPYNNNSKIYSIAFLTTDYKTPENISIGSTWGDVIQAYPNIEFWFLFEWFDYVSYSYKKCVYLRDPATSIGFIFNESQFSQSQLNSIYEAIGATDYDKQFFVSSLSSSVYQSISSSVTVGQIVTANIGEISETQQSETNNIRDIDKNTSADLIGTKWTHFHNNASSGYKTTELSFNEDNNLIIINFSPPERVNLSSSDEEQLEKIKRVDVKYYYNSNSRTGYYISSAGEKVSFIKNNNTITVDFGSDVFVFYGKSQQQIPITDKIQKSTNNTYTILGLGNGSITYPDGKEVNYFSYKGTQYIYLTIYDDNIGSYEIEKVTAISSKGNYTATFKDYVHDLSENFIGYDYQGGYQDFCINNWIITITKK